MTILPLKAVGPGDAAGLGRGEEGLRGGEVGKIERRVDLDVAEAQRRVDVVGVDAAGNREMISRNTTLRRFGTALVP